MDTIKTWEAWGELLGEDAFLRALQSGAFVQDRSAHEWGGPLLYRRVQPAQ